MASEESHSNRMEEIGRIIDIFEDWLESKGITKEMIHNDERDLDGLGKYAAIIYGEDYDRLSEKLCGTLD